MKQILFFLILLTPYLALAQYPANGNQKITLGEQTTADGIIWRGVASDTTLTAKSDTAAYFVLDTVNLNLYTYKASASGKKWTQLGADTASLNLVSRFAAKLNISDTASMLTPYWRSGRFSGTLPVANGGTGATSFSPNNYLIRTNSSGIFDTSVVYEAGGFVGVSNSSPIAKLDVSGNLRVANPTTTNEIIFNSASSSYESRFMFNVANANKWAYGINSSTPNFYYYTYGHQQFAMNLNYNDSKLTLYSLSGAGSRAVNADADGVLSASSDSRLKKQDFEHEIEGLNEIMQLKPVAYKWLDAIKNRGDQAMTEIGFFADDVAQIIPSAAPLGNDGYYGFYDRAILAAMVKAMQEQQAQIEQLKQRILNLENK